MYRMDTWVVLLRHGQSIWNKENRFTGWTDVDLTEQGMAEARQAAQQLLDLGDLRHPRFDPRYAHLAPGELPATELLQDTYRRVVMYWEQSVVPHIRSGERVLVSAHGNSLRALVKYLDGISDEEMPKLNIPTGIPLVYEMDGNLAVHERYYLGDSKEIEKATAVVAAQALVSQDQR
jgi:2,3-bisphosphoglycerate-dependent phosphoglycerate mutase